MLTDTVREIGNRLSFASAKRHTNIQSIHIIASVSARICKKTKIHSKEKCFELLKLTSERNMLCQRHCKHFIFRLCYMETMPQSPNVFSFSRVHHSTEDENNQSRQEIPKTCCDLSILWGGFCVYIYKM